MLETLFRCILVRPPTEVSVGKPIPLKSESPFQMELEQLRRLNDDNVLSRIHDQVSRFIRYNDNFIDRISRLNFGYELKELIIELKKDKKPQDIITELTNITNTIFGDSPLGIISMEKFKKDLRNIKDSIIAIKIDNIPSHSTNLLQLTDFLYAISCINDIENNQEYLKKVENYRHIFERQLVLPQEIFPLNNRENSQETPTLDTTPIAFTDLKDELTEKLKNFKKLEFALNELRSFDPKDLEYNPNDGKILLALKRDALDKFSNDTVKIIKEEMKLNPNALPIDKLYKILLNARYDSPK